MKKIITLIFIFTIAFSLSGCEFLKRVLDQETLLPPVEETTDDKDETDEDETFIESTEEHSSQVTTDEKTSEQTEEQSSEESTEEVKDNYYIMISDRRYDLTTTDDIIYTGNDLYAERHNQVFLYLNGRSVIYRLARDQDIPNNISKENRVIDTGVNLTITYNKTTNEVYLAGKLIDVFQVQFNDLEVLYDKKEKSLTATNLPKGVRVDYENNKHTYPGKYEVTAYLYQENNDYLLDTLTATLTITYQEHRMMIIRSNHYPEVTLTKNPSPEEDVLEEFTVRTRVIVGDQLSFSLDGTAINPVPETPIGKLNNLNKDLIVIKSCQKAYISIKNYANNPEKYVVFVEGNRDYDFELNGVNLVLQKDGTYQASIAITTINQDLELKDNLTIVDFEKDFTTNNLITDDLKITEPQCYIFTLRVEFNHYYLSAKVDSGRLSIKQVLELPKQVEVKISGTIVAKNDRGFLLEDETGVIFVRFSRENVKFEVGDDVSITATTSALNKVPMLSIFYPDNFQKIGESVVKERKPTPLNQKVIDDFYGSVETAYQPVYVEITGIMNFKSYNFQINYEDKILRFYDICLEDILKVNNYNNNEIVVNAWIYAPNNKHVYTMFDQINYEKTPDITNPTDYYYVKVGDVGNQMETGTMQSQWIFLADIYQDEELVFLKANHPFNYVIDENFNGGTNGSENNLMLLGGKLYVKKAGMDILLQVRFDYEAQQFLIAASFGKDYVKENFQIIINDKPINLIPSGNNHEYTSPLGLTIPLVKDSTVKLMVNGVLTENVLAASRDSKIINFENGLGQVVMDVPNALFYLKKVNGNYVIKTYEAIEYSTIPEEILLHNQFMIVRGRINNPLKGMFELVHERGKIIIHSENFDIRDEYKTGDEVLVRILVIRTSGKFELNLKAKADIMLVNSAKNI